MKLPSKLIGLSAPVRQGLRSTFHTLLYRCRQRKSLRVVALGQRLRHFADHIAATGGANPGQRVRNWFQDKKAGDCPHSTGCSTCKSSPQAAFAERLRYATT